MAETFYWGVEAMKALISLWGNDNIRSILEGKNEEKSTGLPAVRDVPL